MAVMEGKTASERNKMIAAVVLGVLALIAMYFAFGRSLFSGSASTTPSPAASPTPTRADSGRPADRPMRSMNEQEQIWGSTPVLYQPGAYRAPDPGRNIFAFYEPPPPCKPGIDCPSPTPTPYVEITPIPTPTPHMMVGFVTPTNVYAGSKSFRLEVNGDRFVPEARIYFNQSVVPTTFVSPNRLTAEIPANFIANEGPRQIIVQTPDGVKYSNAVMISVQAPPKPQFQYVGMIARRHANNDTAVFREQGKTEFSARLNDVVGGRFRLVSISSEESVVEDTTLGFRHKLALFRPAPGTLTSTIPPMQQTPGIRRQPNVRVVRPQNPAAADSDDAQEIPGIPSNPTIPPGGSIPGIPDNIPRYEPPVNTQRPRPANPKDNPVDN